MRKCSSISDDPLLKSQYVDAIFASAELFTFHRQLEINAVNANVYA